MSHQRWEGYTISMTAGNVKEARRPGPPRLPLRLLESNSFLLKRLGYAAKERALEAFERAGLGPYHHAVLEVLAEEARETQGAIADALGYDQGQLVGLIDELEERELVKRRRDPNDRRRYLVSLTPEGERALTDLRSLVRELEEQFLTPLNQEEREALHTLLLKLASRHEPRCASIAAGEGSQAAG